MHHYLYSVAYAPQELRKTPAGLHLLQSGTGWRRWRVEKPDPNTIVAVLLSSPGKVLVEEPMRSTEHQGELVDTSEGNSSLQPEARGVRFAFTSAHLLNETVHAAFG